MKRKWSKLNLSNKCSIKISVYFRQYSTSCHFSKDESWVVLSPIEKQIKVKVEQLGTPLKDWNIRINYGIKTGFNEAFIIDSSKRKQLIDEDPKSEEIIRPLLRGRDIKRYSHEFADLHLITTFPSLKIDIEQYPAVKQYLMGFGYDRLKQTGDKGARKKTNNRWFETQDSISYWEDFFQQKILWAETMRIRKENSERFPRFSYTTKPFYTDKTCFIAVGEDLKYVLAFLNSTVGRYQLSQTVSMMDNGGYLMQKIYIEQIKISTLDQKQKIQLIKLVDSLLDISDDELAEGFENQIDTIIFNSFGIEPHEQKYLNNMLAEPLERA
nr:TaqI-like C-terminal specificity domain-containing protein [Sphingobacterium sp.]